MTERPAGSGRSLGGSYGTVSGESRIDFPLILAHGEPQSGPPLRHMNLNPRAGSFTVPVGGTHPASFMEAADTSGATDNLITTMSLDYHYEFRAPEAMPVAELKSFLAKVGKHALELGFSNAVTIDCVFRSVDQLDFARRICVLPWVEDERLKTVDFSTDPAVHRQDRELGECGVFPVHGVVLVVVNETGLETTFGFLKFPPAIEGMTDVGSRVRIENPVGADWRFGQRVQSPDPRYRALVRDFAEAGFLASEEDEYFPEGRR